MSSVHVALTFDNDFWAPAYATMRGIALSTMRPVDLVFHLFWRDLSNQHRKELGKIGDEFGSSILDYDIKSNSIFREFVEGLEYHPKLTNIVYARLLLDRYLPQSVNRIIYVDCDILVRSPIEILGELDLGSNALAAVGDAHRHRFMLGRDLRENHDLFTFHMPYFNAGMMVIDRAAYGRADVPGRTRELHESGILRRLQYDQGALNIIFRDNWLPLDFRWNLVNPLPAHENLEPHILHYTGHRKPWHLYSPVAFARAYRHTMTNDIFYRYWRERQRKRLAKPFRRLTGRR